MPGRERDFLEYVARHEARLRLYVLKATGSHDAFGDALVKVYDTVARSQPAVRNWGSYFVRAAIRTWGHTLKRESRYERIDPEIMKEIQ